MRMRIHLLAFLMRLARDKSMASFRRECLQFVALYLGVFDFATEVLLGATGKECGAAARTKPL